MKFAARLRRTAQDRLPDAFAFLVRGFYFVFLLIPFVIAIPTSFSRFVVFPPNGFTLEWYAAFFASRDFGAAWKVSLAIALIAAILSTIIGTTLALAVTRYRIPGGNLLINLTLSPLIVPGVATGVGLVFLFTWLGILDGWSRLILAHVVVTVPYVARVMVAMLQGFNRTLEEAAMNLGANEVKVFLTVTLPIVRPGLAAGFLFAFMASFSDLPVSVFVVQPGTATLPVILFSNIRDDLNPIIAVVTVITVGIAGLAMWLADRLVGLDRLFGLRPTT